MVFVDGNKFTGHLLAAVENPRKAVEPYRMSGGLGSFFKYFYCCECSLAPRLMSAARCSFPVFFLMICSLLSLIVRLP